MKYFIATAIDAENKKLFASYPGKDIAKAAKMFAASVPTGFRVVKIEEAEIKFNGWGK